VAAEINTKNAHLVRQHRDITAIYTYINDERAMVLTSSYRAGCPWFCILESAAYSWDDEEPGNIPEVVRKASKACEVLGIEPTAQNARRIAEIVIDGLPDLIRMPTAKEKEMREASFGKLQLRADGQLLAEEDIKVEKEAGATYG
jgi:hypothetical protein